MWNSRKCWSTKDKEGSECGAAGAGDAWVLCESLLGAWKQRRETVLFAAYESCMLLLPLLECEKLGRKIYLLHPDGSCLAQHMEEKRWSQLSQLGWHLDLTHRVRGVAHQAVPIKCSLGSYLLDSLLTLENGTGPGCPTKHAQSWQFPPKFWSFLRI